MTNVVKKAESYCFTILKNLIGYCSAQHIKYACLPELKCKQRSQRFGVRESGFLSGGEKSNGSNDILKLTDCVFCNFLLNQ